MLLPEGVGGRFTMPLNCPPSPLSAPVAAEPVLAAQVQVRLQPAGAAAAHVRRVQRAGRADGGAGGGARGRALRAAGTHVK